MTGSWCGVSDRASQAGLLRCPIRRWSFATALEQDDPAQPAELIAAGLAPSQNLEAGIAATLPPGLYTALLAGRNNGIGVGLVEVYDRGGAIVKRVTSLQRCHSTLQPFNDSAFNASVFSHGWRMRSVRITLARLGFADIDPMFEALRAIVRLGLNHVNAKSRAGERLAERFLVRR